MSHVYQQWGFATNPFLQTPLPPNLEGASLLVGRQAELKQIRLRLASPPKLVTVEGRNGIGKTSVINVAAYHSLAERLQSGAGLLLLACAEPFQLDPSTDVDTFAARVFHRVAVTLCAEREVLSTVGLAASGLDDVCKWVGLPVLKGRGGGLSAVGFGANLSGATSVNASAGFKDAGFEASVKAVLAELFPKGENGAVICVIDNLELMKTSKAARELIEALRDRVLTVPGLRWVLSGAAGIVRGIGSTPRLSGYLHDPIDVGDFPQELAGEILTRRVQTFRQSDEAALPLHPEDFNTLFKVLHGNIRDTLSEADNFCTHICEKEQWLPAQAPDRDAFREWLKNQCTSRLAAANASVTPRPWQLFDDIIAKGGGQCAPGDFEAFGFESQQAMRSHVLKLEETNLIQSLRDEDDNRRKTIIVTSNGWMVHFARSKELDGLFPKPIVEGHGE
jgi:DNA-binding MarR family transcriptional regulator